VERAGEAIEDHHQPARDALPSIFELREKTIDDAAVRVRAAVRAREKLEKIVERVPQRGLFDRLPLHLGENAVDERLERVGHVPVPHSPLPEGLEVAHFGACTYNFRTVEQIGPYAIERKIGEGGMGIVYAARDERLNRTVAIKTMREAVGDATARERFVREARAAASLNHPNICQLFDIGECDGKPFIVMELLEGESLSDRLHSGAVALPDAVRFALGVLTALEPLHARGLVHRDLKPSNVFLTAHGVKLLDFGLAREAHRSIITAPDAPTLRFSGSDPLTLPGMIVGTPRYMAPEQLLTGRVDERSDIFAVGAIVYEMASGMPAFDGDSAMKILHAVVYEQPPNLGGSAAIAALNRIVRRAMEKNADDRYKSAGAMAADLREMMMISDAGSPVTARRMTRIIALPFRILRPDPETDFLAHAVPDAVTSSLAGLDSITVRSSLAASKMGDVDLKKLAVEADVDVVLTGTLLRAGEQLRVTTQLVEVPAGTLLWSMTSNGSPANVFELQDSLTHRIIQSLDLPLSEREQRQLRGDVAANPQAHEFYLRAGEHGSAPSAWPTARDLYERAVAEDPRFAPAWARLARIYMLIGKYGTEPQIYYKKSEDALRRALEINPDLPLAHHNFAILDVTTGNAESAMLRLLDRVHGGTNDPEVFAGLVTATRFCGLLEASAAAHEQARQLDPTISTSAQHTYWMMGDYEKSLAAVDRARDFGGDEAFVLESMGNVGRALEVLDERARSLSTVTRTQYLGVEIVEAFRYAILGKPNPVAQAVMERYVTFPDPEGQYYMSRCLARIGNIELSLDALERSERNGFFCYPIFARDPWLDVLRGETRFIEAVRRAETRYRDALHKFDQHPGSRVLGVGRRR
jgi:serine/threonine protein kinase